MSNIDNKIYIIPYKGELFQERRKSYFLKAFGEEVRDMRIFPFGKCNYFCPYCKRTGYDKKNSVIVGSVEVESEKIFHAISESIKKGEIVRLSGGDPCTYPELSKRMLQYVKELGGNGSMAHNASAPDFIKDLTENCLLNSISIDFKAENAEKLSKIAGISEKSAISMWDKTLKTIEVLKFAKGVKVDIRTCVFNDTSFDELLNIGKIIQKHANDRFFWTLRIYSIVDSFSKKTKRPEEMKKLAQCISKQIPNLRMGIRLKWENGAFFYFMNGEELNI